MYIHLFVALHHLFLVTLCLETWLRRLWTICSHLSSSVYLLVCSHVLVTGWNEALQIHVSMLLVLRLFSLGNTYKIC